MKLGSDRADPSGAKAPDGPAYPYDGCRGKTASFLCPERGRRIPGGVEGVVPALWTIHGVNPRKVLRV